MRRASRHFLFSSDLTTVGWLGVLFGLASGLGFAVSKYRLSKALEHEGSPTQTCRRAGGATEMQELLERGLPLPAAAAGGGGTRDRRNSS